LCRGTAHQTTRDLRRGLTCPILEIPELVLFHYATVIALVALDGCFDKKRDVV
jgi:hypothetical protein